MQELRNFKFLQKQYEFEVLENETPVILFKNNKPISAGRLDLVLKYKNKIVGADIKCTAKLDREYAAYQVPINETGAWELVDEYERMSV